MFYSCVMQVEFVHAIQNMQVLFIKYLWKVIPQFARLIDYSKTGLKNCFKVTKTIVYVNCSKLVLSIGNSC